MVLEPPSFFRVMCHKMWFVSVRANVRTAAVPKSDAERRARLAALMKKPLNQLHALSEQFAFQRRFEVELAAVTRGKRFRVRNLDLWNTLLNGRDGLAVHIVSWATSIYEEGGLFGIITSDGLIGGLSPGSKRDVGAKEKWQQEYWFGHHLAVFKRGFRGIRPKRGIYRPEEAHMKALRDRFVARFKLLDADRNRYRAHAFEKQSVGSVRQMHSPGRAQALRFAQRTMKDLLLL